MSNVLTLERPMTASQQPRPATREWTNSPHPLRLTRRGRLALFGAAAVVFTGLSIALGSAVVATSEAGPATELAEVRVEPGQTLWGIAAEANPSGDIRDTVDEIVLLNSLENGSKLQMGTMLAVPVYE